MQGRRRRRGAVKEAAAAMGVAEAAAAAGKLSPAGQTALKANLLTVLQFDPPKKKRARQGQTSGGQTGLGSPRRGSLGTAGATAAQGAGPVAAAALGEGPQVPSAKPLAGLSFDGCGEDEQDFV